jgi:hypothetical protein
MPETQTYLTTLQQQTFLLGSILMSVKSAILTVLFSLVSVATHAAQPVTITVPTIVYDTSDPRFCANCSYYKRVVVTDTSRLKSLDGVGSTESFAEYLADGSSEEKSLAEVLSGGHLRLTYLPKQEAVVATVTYDANRALAKEEISLLAEYTSGQLLDGIGENFTQSATKDQELWVEFDVHDSKKIVIDQTAP